MLVEEIELSGFMTHSNSWIELPARGVTVITGKNGSGKSTVIEAVAYAHWGKTLRGSTPWREAEAGTLRVSTDQVEVVQKVTKKGSRTLKWRRRGEDEFEQFDTQTTARKGLAEEVGEFDLWRKTHVFSSADAAHFSAATDMQRKQLIESVLGLEVFDKALSKCRDDLHAARANQMQVQGEHMTLIGKYNGLKVLLENWLEEIPFEVEPEPEKPAEPAEGALVLELQKEMSELQDAVVDVRRASMATLPSEVVVEMEKAKNAMDLAEIALKRADAGLCGECGREFDDGDTVEAQAVFDAAQASFLKVNAAKTKQRLKIEVERQGALNAEAAMQEDIDRVRIDLNRCEQAMSEFARWQTAHAVWEMRQESRRKGYDIRKGERMGMKAAKEAEMLATWVQLEELNELEDGYLLEIDELQVAEKVLGMRGVRVKVLGHALAGIEHVANGWLSRMSSGVKVELKSFTETKTAGINDALSLEIHGVGGGHGYKATSGGERRRVDAALILGLAEVAAAASGGGDGTLWMDEVFDALDVDGCAAVAECLSELGKTRSVVVITHREELADAISAQQRFEARDGFLYEV